MGDLIEGPDGIGESAFRVEQPHRKTKMSHQSLRVFRFAPLIGAVFAFLIAGALIKFNHDVGAFALKVTGLCFETNVGARGLAEGTLGTNEVILIFSSGLREDYAMKDLREIPCGELNLPTESARNGS